MSPRWTPPRRAASRGRLQERRPRANYRTGWKSDGSKRAMARITVEDCVTQVPNRFELVMLAAQRARDVSAGASLTVERDNDKTPVVALREIAEGTVELDHLRYELIHGLRRHVEIEDQPDDDLLMA